MVSDDVSIQYKAWAKSLQTGVDPAILDLATIVFDLSPDQDRLEKLGGFLHGGKNLGEKNYICLTLLTLSLISNGLASFEDLEATPLDLVSVIHKVPFCGFCLPS